MRAYIRQFAMTLILLTIATLLSTAPVAARPKDPDGFRWTPCLSSPPAACRSSSTPAFIAAVPPRTAAAPAEAQALLYEATDAVMRAGSLSYKLDMQTTIANTRGGSWAMESTLSGDYTAPDRLQRVLTIANPWATTQSQIKVADGTARVSNPQTGEWDEGLKFATRYYPVIFTGCLLRMSEADMDSRLLVGTEMLEGEPVYHLKGRGGARDELDIEYWLGVGDGLPKQAVVRAQARPGWSNEVHTVRITATLRLGNHGKAAILPSR